jgi:porin
LLDLALRRITLLAACSSSVLIASAASAQQSSATQPAAAPSTAIAPAVIDSDDPDAQYKNVRIKGYDIPLPGPSDTIEGDLGGLREKLADVGIGWFGYTPTNLFYNVARHDHGGAQVYSGQRFTVGWGTPFLVAYDLGRLGLGDAQLTAGLQVFKTTWNPSGPRQLSLSTLTLYKSLFNKRIELKAGYMANGFEFYNPYIAGNFAAGVFGTSASIPAEVGLSTTSYTKPGANIKINLGHFYDKAGIQAAISPDGTVAEKQANPTGFKFHTADAGTFYINEFGYRHEADVGHRQIWLRAAIMKSTSAYENALTDQRIHGQWGAYVLGDRQFVQFGHDKRSAYRGVYAGFSAMYAPPRINRFSQYYEFRLYGIGLIKSRPHDMMSLILADNVFGHDYVDQTRLTGNLAHGSAKSATVSYTANVIRGVTVGLGAGYTDHPTPIIYTPETGHAVTLISNLVINY